MNVQLIYRNYKPLHSLYQSLIDNPPAGVDYLVAKQIKLLNPFYGIYKNYGDMPFIKKAISLSQKYLFSTRTNFNADILEYIQIVPSNIPPKPYIVDFEHVAALLNFVSFDNENIRRVFSLLLHDNCKKIIGTSNAAVRSLRYLFGNDYDRIAAKVCVIYPSVPYYHANCDKEGKSLYIKNSNKSFKLLFVGNDVYRKGLHELLKAFSRIENDIKDIELYIISDIPSRLKQKYGSSRIFYFRPKFSISELLKYFYSNCDLFVMPTHCDTFGMVILEALSAGVPVLTTNQFASSEIIDDHETGILLRSNSLYLEEYPLPDRESSKNYFSDDEDAILVSDLIENILYLYKNRSVLEKMSYTARQNFKAMGKFSAELRNKKLLKIYEDITEG